MLINAKMPTTVGILTFISMINTTSESFKAREILNFSAIQFLWAVEISYSVELSMKSFIISGPVYKLVFSGIEDLTALEELDIAHNMLVDHQCLLPLLKFRKLMIVSDQLTLYALMDYSLSGLLQ